MKRPLALILVLNVLLVWPGCLVAEVKSYEADVCVYGGTASGVMAALAAEKEGSKVVLIEPTRWLGGMTGGGIRKRNTPMNRYNALHHAAAIIVSLLSITRLNAEEVSRTMVTTSEKNRNCINRPCGNKPVASPSCFTCPV